MTKPRIIVASEIKYIDPIDCGSSVGYTITKRYTRVSGAVSLTDCNRIIQWYFQGDDRKEVDKIDRAISILQNFKRDWESAIKKNKS